MYHAGYATPTIQPNLQKPEIWQQPEMISSDNIYLNVVFDHADATFPAIGFSGGIPSASGGASTGAQPVPAEYNKSKTLPILDNCSDYYCSVVRFEIPLDSVPLYIMPIIPNQPNNDLTIYVVGFTFSGVTYSQNVMYLPDNNILLPHNNGSGFQNQPFMVIDPYYYVFTYQNLLNSINAAIDGLWLVSGLSGASPSGTCPPFFSFDAASQLFSITIPQELIPGTSGEVDASLFINSPLQTLFNSFELSFNDTDHKGYNQPYGADFFFIFNDFINNVVETFSGCAGNYITYTQEYPTTQNWVSLRKLLITTNTIPIQSEFVPTFNMNGSQKSDAGSLNILTDFTPQIETLAGASRTIAYYVPTSQYRLIDMKASRPLYNIQLKILWQDKSGNLFPVLISVTQQASVKLAFLKKSLYKNMNYLLGK